MVDTPALLQLRVRKELRAYLSELQADDPRDTWRAERASGLVSGIDQVFHFFFDDHDFDATAVGLSLVCATEVRLIGDLKNALAAILDEIGDAGDDDFVSHPRWPMVRQAANTANAGLARDANGS